MIRMLRKANMLLFDGLNINNVDNLRAILKVNRTSAALQKQKLSMWFLSPILKYGDYNELSWTPFVQKYLYMN